MIISLLCDYYKYLRARQECEGEDIFAPEGYKYEENISFNVVLLPDGKISNILS